MTVIARMTYPIPAIPPVQRSSVLLRESLQLRKMPVLRRSVRQRPALSDAGQQPPGLPDLDVVSEELRSDAAPGFALMTIP